MFRREPLSELREALRQVPIRRRRQQSSRVREVRRCLALPHVPPANLEEWDRREHQDADTMYGEKGIFRTCSMRWNITAGHQPIAA